MTTWFSSDYHFGHERILSLSNRLFVNVNHMNEAIINNHNAIVAPDDTVYILGDIALGTLDKSLPLVKRLNGIKILIVGNHDRLFIDPESSVEKAKRYVDRFRPAYEDVFDDIIEGDESEAAKVYMTVGDFEVCLSHFPYTGDSNDKSRYNKIRPVDNGMVLLHGHTHSSEKISRSANGTLQIHVGVDSWGYRPVSEDEILSIIKAER